MIKILRIYIVEHFYTIFVVLGVFSFLKMPDLYSYVILLIVLSTILSFAHKPLIWNGMDVLVCLFVLYQLVSVLFSSYPFTLWYNGIRNQIIPILFYFIGRNMLFAKNTMLEQMKVPMLIAMVWGVVLYFWAPSWYIARRTENLTGDMSVHVFYEMTRLSSFWDWSYTMGYGALFYLMYYIRDFFRDKLRKYDYFSLITALLVLFFAQQRVTIVFFFVFLMIVALFGRYPNKIRLLYVFLGVMFAGVAIGYYLLCYADSSFVEYLLNRSVDSDENIILKRFQQFASFWKVSFLGEGLGKYGHAAIRYNMESIADCEYIRLMAELGIIGCLILGTILFKAAYHSFIYIRYYLFEFSIILFLGISMIGAAPLEMFAMQPFLYWYCIGRISNKRLWVSPKIRLHRIL